MSQTPRIVYSELGKCWYVVTRYTLKKGLDADTGEPKEYLVAQRKFDVTDQMTTILEAKKS